MMNHTRSCIYTIDTVYKFSTLTQDTARRYMHRRDIRRRLLTSDASNCWQGFHRDKHTASICETIYKMIRILFKGEIDDAMSVSIKHSKIQCYHNRILLRIRANRSCSHRNYTEHWHLCFSDD
uniref:AlNc14C410G11450 protein n=1 Tax=Albugo laibachii Nc14 TaxID=890382 RepID=F0WEZ4_9STRA|nr:AlNc14C78G5192 [Albugo laibachii Nc14]CCA26757.1 AlNc14C410G11450 [Albugo laibachii Nc14]|eukprot:CCA26757.1 AlNc14C410G11450 [Albugo laibachii Nc14]